MRAREVRVTSDLGLQTLFPKGVGMRGLSLLLVLSLLLTAGLVTAQDQELFSYMIKPDTQYDVYVLSQTPGKYWYIRFSSTGNVSMDKQYIQDRLLQDFHNVREIPYDPNSLNARTLVRQYDITPTPNINSWLGSFFGGQMPFWVTILIVLIFIGILFWICSKFRFDTFSQIIVLMGGMLLLVGIGLLPAVYFFLPLAFFLAGVVIRTLWEGR